MAPKKSGRFFRSIFGRGNILTFLLFLKTFHYKNDKKCKGPSINDVSSEGEGGGPPSKPIYYISLFSNLSRQGERGGVINSGKSADVVYGWPLIFRTNLSESNTNNHSEAI